MADFFVALAFGSCVTDFVFVVSLSFSLHRHASLPAAAGAAAQDNLFGLQTLDAAGKVFFETTPGNHLQFNETSLLGWLDAYFL
jgi:hypothetical protein